MVGGLDLEMACMSNDRAEIAMVMTTNAFPLEFKRVDKIDVMPAPKSHTLSGKIFHGISDHWCWLRNGFGDGLYGE